MDAEVARILHGAQCCNQCDQTHSLYCPNQNGCDSSKTYSDYHDDAPSEPNGICATGTPCGTNCNQQNTDSKTGSGCSD
jgi:hypothetical protein